MTGPRPLVGADPTRAIDSRVPAPKARSRTASTLNGGLGRPLLRFPQTARLACATAGHSLIRQTDRLNRGSGMLTGQPAGRPERRVERASVAGLSSGSG